MSTYFPKAGEIVRKWYVVDASGQTLGRLASQVARVLMGKENPKYTPFLDTGDHVIVINADKVKMTGMKAEQKVYQHYTGYPGGLRTEEFRKRFELAFGKVQVDFRFLNIGGLQSRISPVQVVLESLLGEGEIFARCGPLSLGRFDTILHRASTVEETVEVFTF